MRAPFTLAVIATLAGCAQVAPSDPAAATAPVPSESACTGEAYRAFNFWIGRWDVVRTETGEVAGSSVIEAAENGCVILERYSTARGYSGRSINIYDARAGHWEQFWVDNQGDRTHFVGGPTADGMRLVAENDFTQGVDGPVATRMTFTANPDGSVRQHGEVSTDGGDTWQERYDLTYRRAAE